MKELKIEVPKGYEIDKENSTFECIKFKKKQDIKTWDDLCKHVIVNLKGYYIDNYSNIIEINTSYNSIIKEEDRNVFLTVREAKSARAASMISQLMPYYGDAITDKEWSDGNIIKYIICRDGSDLDINQTSFNYHYLAFRTEEYRDEFLKNCKDLVKQYLMIK